MPHDAALACPTFRNPSRSARSRKAWRQGAAACLLALASVWPAAPTQAEAPRGQVTWGVHISLAPTWFDPAEMGGIVTPYMMMYAMHEAMAKPMPDNPLAPGLAKSWTITPDGLTYEFVLREGVRFHDGSPVTAADVKFSFERYRGTSNKLLKDRVASVEAVDPGRVRFKLKQPWPDFMTFYTTATGAGWIVPKAYVEKVGDEGFKKAPIGAGPYKFVSFRAGIELVLEAHEQFWRKPPQVKRLVFRAIPDESTRLAALKGGEVDVAYALPGELGREIQRTPGLTLMPLVLAGTQWVYFADQFDPKSPWHDERVRRAASLVMDRHGINQALMLGHSLITGSIVPDTFDYFWRPPAPELDVAKARQLLAEAGQANGFNAGDYYCDAVYANVAESIIDNLRSIGIRAKLRPIERAAFLKEYGEKRLRNLVQGGSGAFGNAATRLEAFVVKSGTFAYGSYPDLDELFQKQADELDRGKREALLRRMQEIVHERTIYAPIWQLGFINGVGPRVKVSGLGLIKRYPYSAPYEDVALQPEGRGSGPGAEPSKAAHTK